MRGRSVWLALTLAVAAGGAAGQEAAFTRYADPQGPVVRFADERSVPFPRPASAAALTPSTGTTRRAVREFAEVRDCLVPEERRAARPDLSSLDLERVTSHGALAVCLWRIGNSYARIEALVAALAKHGFVFEGESRHREGERRLYLARSYSLGPLFRRGFWGSVFEPAMTYRVDVIIAIDEHRAITGIHSSARTK